MWISAIAGFQKSAHTLGRVTPNKIAAHKTPPSVAELSSAFFHHDQKGVFNVPKKRVSPEERREYYWTNRERLIQQSRARYQKNREKILAYNRRYYNPVPVLKKPCERCGIVFQPYRNRVRFCGSISLKVGCSFEYQKEYKKVRLKITGARRRKREVEALGEFTFEQWNELKAIFSYRCARCFLPEPSIKLEADHKVPLALNGTNYIDNIQPLCGHCNRVKSVKIWFASCPLDKQEVTWV